MNKQELLEKQQKLLNMVDELVIKKLKDGKNSKVDISQKDSLSC